MSTERTIPSVKIADLDLAGGNLRCKGASRSEPIKGGGEAHLKGLSVLIVEDDWPSAKLLTGTLGNEGGMTRTV